MYSFGDKRQLCGLTTLMRKLLGAARSDTWLRFCHFCGIFWIPKYYSSNANFFNSDPVCSEWHFKLSAVHCVANVARQFSFSGCSELSSFLKIGLLWHINGIQCRAGSGSKRSGSGILDSIKQYLQFSELCFCSSWSVWRPSTRRKTPRSWRGSRWRIEPRFVFKYLTVVNRVIWLGHYEASIK